MFLHSGASLHGHEYSTRHSLSSLPGPSSSVHNLRKPLRAAFSSASPSATSPASVSAVAVSKTTYVNPARVSIADVSRPDAVSRSSCVRSRRPVSECLPPLSLSPVSSCSSASPRETKTPVVRFAEVPPSSPAGHQRPEKRLSLPLGAHEARNRRPMNADHVVSDSELSDATLATLDAAVAAAAASAGTGIGTGTGASSGAARRSVRKSRRARAQRPTTTFFLGYPLPKLLGRRKVMQKVLPRLLLQLQRAGGADGRPLPVLEVFPASRIAGPVIAPRLAKRFPGIIGVKCQLAYEDLVLVRRDDYDRVCGPADGNESDADESSSTKLEEKKIVAVYSPLKGSPGGEAEIVLDDGAVWVATPQGNGNYDFVHVDSHGVKTTARWARRSATTVPPSSLPVDSGATTTLLSTTAPQSRFTFSIINPLTRRHPVMATLTQSMLTVQDTYNSVSPSYGRYPPTRAMHGRAYSMMAAIPHGPAATAQPQALAQLHNTDSRQSSVSSATSEGPSENDSGIVVNHPPESEAERTVHVVDEATQKLISVTALWVALRSGWSPTYTPSPSHNISANNNSTTAGVLADATSPQPSSSTRSGRRNTWARSSTVTLDCPGRHTPLSEPDSAAAAAPANAPPGAPSTPPLLKRYSLPPRHTPTDTSASQSLSTLASLVCPSGSRCVSPARLAENVPAAAATPERLALPRRATSTGAAFMRRRIQILSASTPAAPASSSTACPTEVATDHPQPSLPPKVATDMTPPPRRSHSLVSATRFVGLGGFRSTVANMETATAEFASPTCRGVDSLHSGTSTPEPDACKPVPGVTGPERPAAAGGGGVKAKLYRLIHRLGTR